MNNNTVLVMVKFMDTKRVNNMVVDCLCTAGKEVALDRRFLANLETIVTAFKELGTVSVLYNDTIIGTLEKTAYAVGENRVDFERFGGKIAKAFFSAIDEQID